MRQAPVVACVLLATPGSVFGQADTTRVDALKRYDARSAAVGPPSAVSTSNGQVMIEASQTDGKAVAVVTLESGVTIQLATPLQKGATSTDFASLDGLAGDLTAALAWDGVFGLLNPIRQAAIDRRDPGLAVCTQYGMPAGPNLPTCTNGNLEAFLRAQGRDAEVDEAMDRYDRAFFGDARLWGVSFGGKVGYKKFSYFSEEAVASESRRVSASATLAVSYIEGGRRIAIGLSAERGYRDAKPSARSCSPAEGSPALESCRELPLGAPDERNDVVVRVEWRQVSGDVGLSPVLSWKVDEGILGFDMPFYFVRDAAGRLTGGVRMGWRSDSREPQLGVFVSKPLGLW